MIIFISKTSDTLNKKQLKIENLSDYVCLSPNYRSVTIDNQNTKILMDSGAFQDTNRSSRLSFDDALDRQIGFEKKLNRNIDYIVSYDLIDCYETTIEANSFFNKTNLSCRKPVYMTQGKTLDEYIFCLNENLQFIDDYSVCGLGGISRAATTKKLQEKIFASIGLINKTSINHVHLFGVGSIKLLRIIREKLNKNVLLSSDSSAYEFQSVMGKVLDDTGKWVKTYTKGDKYINYHPCDLSIKNITNAIDIIRRI